MSTGDQRRTIWLPIVLIAALGAVSAAQALKGDARKNSYENFALPSRGERSVSVPGERNYETSKFSMKRGEVSVREPSINHQQYIFAKEAFLAERRDQAIKLIRQQLDAGYTANESNMLLRLGQLYAEKYMELNYLENEVFSTQVKKFEEDKKKNSGLKAPKLENSRSRQNLKFALDIFYNLERKYPRHPKLDEVLFFIGFVEMESGNGEKGSRYLERVLRDYPKSRKYDETLLYLGDYYFDRHQLKQAEAKFRILYQRKNPQLSPYARYKIAWCLLNGHDKRRALEEMKQLIGELEESDSKGKFNLRDQALKDLVVFYGETGSAREAYSYYEGKVGRDQALKNLRLIADILRTNAKDKEAVDAYKMLLSEEPGNLEAPAIELGMHESMYRTGNPRAAVKHLQQVAEKYGPQSDFAKNYPPEKQKELASMQQAIQNEVFKMATFYHHAAQKGSNVAQYELALELYTGLLNGYPNYPEAKKVSFYRGEILFNQKKWLAAADAYMITAKMKPKDSLADEALYNALLALDNLTYRSGKIDRFDEEKIKKGEWQPEEIPVAEQRFIEVSDYYLREHPNGGRVVDVRFRMGSVYYQYHHFDKALEQFKEVATRYPTHRAAVTAANLALDIYNIQKQYDKLDETAKVFAETQGLGDSKFRDEMAKIRSEIGFKSVEKLEAKNQWGDAGKAYLEVYRQDPKGPLAEKALYNSVVSYEKTDDRSKISEVVSLFLAKYPESSHAERLVLTLAKEAEKRYDFVEAQRRYVQFQKRFPKSKEARKALYNAALYSELLEQNSAALALYDQYLKLGGVDDKEQVSITISRAKLFRKMNNWTEVNKIYRRLAAKAGSAAEKAVYLGELAYHYERGGKTSDRTQLMKELWYLYRNHKDAKYQGNALRYIAEAAYQDTRREREKFDKIKLRFPAEDLVYLLKLKQRRLLQLAKSYDEVIGVGVPEWGVAAIFEKADSYESLVREYRSVQVPAKYKDAQRKEMVDNLRVIDGQMIRPLEIKAKEFLKACVDKAVEFYVSDEYSEKCHSRFYANQGVPAPSGLMPRPDYWSMRPLGAEVAVK